MPENPPTSGTPPAVAIVVSRYNATITDAMRAGALRAYAQRGGDPSSVLIVEAPGAFELTALSLAAAQRDDIAGVVALGCIIQGETTHDEVLAHAVAMGLTNVTLATGKPVSFGVLTCRNAEQARARAGLASGGGGQANKGEEAMAALLDSLDELARLAAGGVSSGRSRPPLTRPDKTRG